MTSRPSGADLPPRRSTPERVLPTGTVTFLFSDIEGSTRLVGAIGPAEYTRVLEHHNKALRGAFAAHAGVERGTQGDSFLVMFPDAPAAIAAAAEAQRALASASWPDGAVVRVRMGIHTGAGVLGGDDYVGIDVHRAARVAAAAHGGQVLMSEAARVLSANDLPAGVSLRRLGEYKLRDLSQPEQLTQLVIDGLPSDFPPLNAGGMEAAGNLPQRLTPLIGREADLAMLERLVGERRLVTLTGAGGTGKTSLALEFARRRADAYADGAWFVPLEAITEASLVPAAIANGFGLVETPGQSSVDRLAAYLADRTVLLVLDNFEQVLGAAPIVGDLLNAVPALTVLATSRSPLRLAHEQEYPLGPLDPPSAETSISAMRDNAAVRLFVERAGRVRPGYEVTDAEAPAVAEICRQLDGLPLAIQLAASSISLLPADAIANRLARQLALPGRGARDVPERQQSVDQAIAWSEELLDPAARRLLARLSVFRSGFRLEEAEVVAGASTNGGTDLLEGLSTLVDQSLVQPIPGPDGPRYRLLEPIRVYAARRLADAGDMAAIERAHALGYLDLAETAAAHLPGAEQRVWLDRLGAEHDNLRAATSWALDHGGVEIALRLGTALWRFWQLRGHIEEGLKAMSRMLELPKASEPTVWRAGALGALGGLRYWSADLPGADALYRAQLDLGRELGDARQTADALFNLSHTRFLLAKDHDAVDLLDAEAERLFGELGDEIGLTRLEWTKHNRLMQRGLAGIDDAFALVRRFEELGDAWYVALAYGTVSWTAFAMGNVADCLRWGLVSINAHHAMGDVASPTITLRYVAIIFSDMGAPEAAATVSAAYEALCNRYGVRPPAFFEELTPILHRRTLDFGAYPEANARGAAMPLDEVLDFIMHVSAELLRAEA
ncbi:MAG: adenylate/guanylate cyclase domain-containing protein [Candidatus Limnocylindria bacterium]